MEVSYQIQKEFFDAFRILPSISCSGANCSSTSLKDVSGNPSCRTCTAKCKKEHYPTITDADYLQLICFLNDPFSDVSHAFSQSVLELKTDILRDCIEYKPQIYCQVHELFEGR